MSPYLTVSLHHFILLYISFYSSLLQLTHTQRGYRFDKVKHTESPTCCLRSLFLARRDIFDNTSQSSSIIKQTNVPNIYTSHASSCRTERGHARTRCSFIDRRVDSITNPPTAMNVDRDPSLVENCFVWDISSKGTFHDRWMLQLVELKA